MNSESGLGWRQRAVLHELRTTFDGHTAENIQRLCAVATQSVRWYLSPSDTQKIMRGLIARGLVERVGPNGYQAASR